MLRFHPCVALAGVAITSIVSAGITVEDGKLSRPERRVHPDDIFVVLNFQITGDFTREFTVGNGYFPENVKFFWMEVVMATGSGAPQEPGSTLDPAKWPTITGVTPGVIHTTTPRHASVFSDFDNNDWRWYFEVRIKPQPGEEIVRFEQGWWDTWGLYINEINIQTVCIPAPAGLTLLAIGIAANMRRRR
jgi:hypothetical protein